MAELNTAEETAKVDAAFGAGFGDTPPAVIPPAKVEDKPVVEPAKPPAAATPPAKPPEKPEYVRITRQERDNDRAAIGKIASLESQIAKMAGNTPNADALATLVIEKIRSQTPAGLAVEFSDEDFAELTDYAPELSTATRAAIERIFKKANVKGTGPADAATVPPAGAAEPIDIGKAVEDALTRRDAKQKADALEAEMKALTEAYPDWGKTVGQPIAMGTTEPVETDWRKWAATNDQTALTSDSPAAIKASIDKFAAGQTVPAKPDPKAARRAVLADAVTPRADGTPPPLNQPTSADDAFNAAFEKTRRH